MNFTRLVPNVFYTDMKDALKLFIDCLGFKIEHNELNSENPFCVIEKRRRRLQMRHFAIFIATALLTICAYNSARAQVDSSSISKTRKYVKCIDSINKLDYVQDKGFMTSVADGIIKKGGRIVGGFGIYTLLNLKGDTAFRIEYHDNLNVSIYKTYYYMSDQLIYATLELQDGRANMKSIYRKEEFYRNGNVIWTSTTKEKSADKYSSKTNVLLYQDGLKFLADFKNDRNSR